MVKFEKNFEAMLEIIELPLYDLSCKWEMFTDIRDPEQML